MARYLEKEPLPPQGFNQTVRTRSRVVETDTPAPGAVPTNEEVRDWEVDES